MKLKKKAIVLFSFLMMAVYLTGMLDFTILAAKTKIRLLNIYFYLLAMEWVHLKFRLHRIIIPNLLLL